MHYLLSNANIRMLGDPEVVLDWLFLQVQSVVWREECRLPRGKGQDWKTPFRSPASPNHKKDEKSTTLKVDSDKPLFTLLINPYFLYHQGVTPAPKSFKSASVFQCDIVGFTTLTSESTAHQTIEMLNDLYDIFDTCISEFDVYKVSGTHSIPYAYQLSTIVQQGRYLATLYLAAGLGLAT